MVFVAGNEVKHTHLPQDQPASNGAAERAVQVIKLTKNVGVSYVIDSASSCGHRAVCHTVWRVFFSAEFFSYVFT